MELRLDGCIVRPYRREDAPSVARHADNRRIWLNTSDRFPHPYTEPDAAAFIEAALAAPEPVAFAVEVDGAAVGGIGFKPGTDTARRSGELGYWLGEAYWGRGIASAIVPAVTRYGFEVLDYVRVSALVYAHNRASARVLEKAGFALEGVLRCSAVKDGVLLDQLLFAKIREGECR